MTPDEKKAVLSFARITEGIFHENVCLKALLTTFRDDSRFLPEWEKWLHKMMGDDNLRQPVHDTFQTIYAQIEQSEDPSKALEALLREIPVSGKSQ